jgi:hypothetical protein
MDERIHHRQVSNSRTKHPARLSSATKKVNVLLTHITAQCTRTLSWKSRCARKPTHKHSNFHHNKSVSTLASKITMGRFSDTRRFGEGAD